MTSNTARRLNDQQLRSETLLVTNPFELVGLSEAPPDTEFVPIIVAEYHLGKDEPEVRCSLCPQRTPHRRGFVVEFRPSSLHLIGSTCGPLHLHLRFGVARRSHTDLMNRQGYLLRIDAITGRLAEWVQACDAILFSSELKILEAKSKEVRGAAGDAFVRLCALSSSGRALSEQIRVRDFERERRRDERSGDDRDAGPIYRQEEVAIGQLRGAAMLRGEELRAEIFRFKKVVQDLAGTMRGNSNDLATDKLRRELMAVEKAHSEASRAVTAINEAHRFFDPEHLALLSRWSESNSADKLAARGGMLIVARRGGPAASIAAPNPATLAPLPDLYRG